MALGSALLIAKKKRAGEVSLTFQNESLIGGLLPTSFCCAVCRRSGD